MFSVDRNPHHLNSTKDLVGENVVSLSINGQDRRPSCLNVLVSR